MKRWRKRQQVRARRARTQAQATASAAARVAQRLTCPPNTELCEECDGNGWDDGIGPSTEAPCTACGGRGYVAIWTFTRRGPG